MVQTKQWVLTNRPDGRPVIDGPNATFTLKEAETGPVKDDHLLLKTLYLSNDPAQRGWLSKMDDPSRLYVPPVEIGAVMRARGLAEVLESSSSKFKKGDVVIATTGWAEKIVVAASEVQPAPQLPDSLA
jgi:NADPH-dependent curcumin reductase CurA